MSLYGNPEELDRIAGRIAARATEVRDRAQDMHSRATGMNWHSASADLARETVLNDRRRLERSADELDAAAAALRKHAQEVRETIAKIQRLEREVKEWFTGAIDRFNNAVDEFNGFLKRVADGVERAIDNQPARPLAPWEHWPHQPHSLPPPGDKGWLEVGEFMKRQGAL
ncbi:WXG100 family type VII secretion target [Pseudonocardiaceae bacterium YIM PH 21723]|nr:WXG100 family type VII secretion target [Pseudonocardiaceae bacterium YIM PH 21723]